ncbi:uncharacterized protein VP01_2190g5 [Puccinia sorghi]|uniref:Uncharacterized protein n=1 Tax=Puccinia sorghi TaxID=27349 RepID=A0A0L6VAY2_9BASI|nr:uncharacterized protein VP01_2190g5 [Puccinia sorghi]
MNPAGWIPSQNIPGLTPTDAVPPTTFNNTPAIAKPATTNQDRLNQVLEDSRFQMSRRRGPQEYSVNYFCCGEDLSDGTNFRKWLERIKELASQFIYDSDFFIKPSTNVHHERIGPAILLHSVDASLKDKLSALPTCFAGYTNLLNQFSSVCRSAQVTTFLKLLRVDPNVERKTVSVGN